MHCRTPYLMLVCASLLAAPFPTAAQAAPRQSPTLVPGGEPVACINTGFLRQTRVIDDSRIDFVLNNGTILRNTLARRCPGLGSSQAFAYAPTASRLCNVDTITVIEQGGGSRRGATCGLGMFEPMKAMTTE